MSYNILHTKLVTEHNRRDIIERAALLSKLKENKEKKVIALIAAAGYGKTTLTKEFLYSIKAPFAWYKLDNSDDNLKKFLIYIIFSLRILYPGFAESALKLADSIKGTGNNKKSTAALLSSIGTIIINEAYEQIKEHLYFVFDDLHELPDDEWVKEAFKFLIDKLPENIHFVITSREHLPFETGTLRAKRKLFELVNLDLKLSDAEVSNVASMYKLTLEPQQADNLNKTMGGWITGVHIYLQSGKQLNEVEKTDSIPLELYNFFAEDIYSSLDDETKSFLLKTSLLPEFDDHLCRSALLISDCDVHLNKLIRRHIFIEKTTASNRIAYKYHELFRAFLNKRLDSSQELNVKELFNRYSKYFEEQGNAPQAIEFALKAENYETAVRLILSNISIQGNIGNLELAAKWLKDIPESIIKENPYMLFYAACNIKNLDLEPDKALPLFYKASEQLIKQQDISFYVRVNTFIADCLIALKRIDEAISHLNKLLKEISDEQLCSHLQYWKGIALYENADYSEALKMLLKARSVAASSNDTILNSIYNQIGNIYLIQGDYDQALHYYKIVESTVSNIYNKFETLLNIIQTLANAGRYDEAKDMLVKAEQLKKTYPAPFFELNYYISEIEVYFNVVDLEKTIDSCNQLLLKSLENNHTAFAFTAYLTTARCHYYNNELKKASDSLEFASYNLERLNDVDKSFYKYWSLLVEKEKETTDAHVRRINELIDFFDEHEMHFEKCHAMFHLSDIYMRLEEFNKADDTLVKVFTDAADNNFHYKFIPEIKSRRYLFERALIKGYSIGFVHELYGSVNDLVDLQWISEKAALNLKAISRSLYSVEALLFGKPEFTINGKRIKDDQWIRKNRRNIFAFILIHRNNPLTKDELLDEFYPESTPENADNQFYQLLSNIRGIVKSSYIDEPPEILMYHDKILQLNNNFLFKIDLDQFNKLYRRFKEMKEYEQKNAIAAHMMLIHKGEFMEGCYDEWCEKIRSGALNKYLEVLNEMQQNASLNNDNKNILIYGEEILKYDRFNAEVIRNVLNAEKQVNNIVTYKKKLKAIQARFKKENEPVPDSLTKIFEST